MALSSRFIGWNSKGLLHIAAGCFEKKWSRPGTGSIIPNHNKWSPCHMILNNKRTHYTSRLNTRSGRTKSRSHRYRRSQFPPQNCQSGSACHGATCGGHFPCLPCHSHTRPHHPRLHRILRSLNPGAAGGRWVGRGDMTREHTDPTGNARSKSRRPHPPPDDPDCSKGRVDMADCLHRTGRGAHRRADVARYRCGMQDGGMHTS